LTLPSAETSAPLLGAGAPPFVNQSGSYAQLSNGQSQEGARHNTPLWSSPQRMDPGSLLTEACLPKPTTSKLVSHSIRYG
jgi:hypothetical protein